jgi:hypothetical protein
MREPLLDESISRLTKLSETNQSPLFGRRQFLQTVAVAGLGLALASEGVLAMPGSTGAMADSPGLWRDCVTGFVYTVCDAPTAEAVNTRLLRTTLRYAPTPTGFHDYFSAPFVFEDQIEPESVICGNGFEVNQFPLYGMHPPCEPCQDLNSSEIKRITNAKERNFYRCVVSPVGERRNTYDHASYLRTIASYPYNPNDFNVAYARTFTTKDALIPGFYITHKTQEGPNGKPLGDVLLG